MWNSVSAMSLVYNVQRRPKVLNKPNSPATVLRKFINVIVIKYLLPCV